MIAALLAEFWPYIAGLAALVAGALGLYAKGRGDADAKADLRDAREHIETRDKIDEAEIHDDPDLARRWLQSRDPDQR